MWPTNSGYTTNIKTIIDSGIDVKAIAMQEYECDDENTREYLNNLFLNHFMYYDIGFETVDMFLFYLRTRLNERMPYWVQKRSVNLLLEGIDPSVTYREVITGNVTVDHSNTLTHGLIVSRKGSDTRTDDFTNAVNLKHANTGTDTTTRSPDLTTTDSGKDTNTRTPDLTQTNSGTDTTTRTPELTTVSTDNDRKTHSTGKNWAFPDTGGSAGSVEGFNDNYASDASLTDSTSNGSTTNVESGTDVNKTEHGLSVKTSGNEKTEVTYGKSVHETGDDTTTLEHGLTVADTGDTKNSGTSKQEYGSSTENTGNDITKGNDKTNEQRTREGTAEFKADVIKRYREALESIETDFVKDKTLNRLFCGLLW